MKYTDIYDSMIDPLHYDDTLDKIAQAYANKTLFGGLYSKLTETTPKYYVGEENTQEKDKFYIAAFNTWKNGIVAITDDIYDKFKYSEVYDERFFALRDFLETVPDITTKEEYEEVLRKASANEIVSSALNDFSWKRLGHDSFWIHVDSEYVTARLYERQQVKHRLYLNVEAIDVHKVANEIVKKCNERDLPYYFKFSPLCVRDDSLVLYCDTEKLPWYIDILKEIEQENPDIVERSGNPPILTGRVDKWFGYGSEPSHRDGKLTSFNEVRVKCINDAFSEEFDKWLQNNRYRKLNIDGKLCSIEEYVASRAAKKQIEIMARDLTAQIKKRGRKEAEDYLGYNQRILASKKLYDKMYAAILKQARNYADEKAGINGQEPGNACIDLRNGKTRTIYLNTIVMPFNEIIPIIIKEDLTFRRNVLARIKKESQKEGVDLSKYCFDFDTRQNFAAMDNQIQTVNSYYNELSQLATRKKLSKPRERKPFESIFAYKDYLTQYSKKCQKAETKPPISKQAKIEPIKGMTEEEIRQSQIKLGFIKPDMEDKPYKVVREPQPYSLTKDEIIQDLPIYSKEESRFKGRMTDEEIRESQIKLGFIKPDIEDKSYKVVRGSQPYSLTRNQIIQDLPINSTRKQTFTGGMTGEEIRAAQKKIGTYQQKRR